MAWFINQFLDRSIPAAICSSFLSFDGHTYRHIYGVLIHWQSPLLQHNILKSYRESKNVFSLFVISLYLFFTLPATLSQRICVPYPWFKQASLRFTLAGQRGDVDMTLKAIKLESIIPTSETVENTLEPSHGKEFRCLKMI